MEEQIKPKKITLAEIKKQQKDVSKFYAPKIDYDKENDILSICWLGQHPVTFSLESEEGYVFDISRQGKEELVVGVEVFDFQEKVDDNSEVRKR